MPVDEAKAPRASRIVVVAPGRGSYTGRELGSLGRLASEPAARAAIEAVDAARREAGRGSVLELDAAKTFSQEVHGAAEDASALILAGSLADAAIVGQSSAHEVVGALGNSLGFYTALGVSGALPIDATAKLVVRMAAHQASLARGGQLLYPIVDDDWKVVPERQAAVEKALAAGALRSIALGGFAVLAFPEDALEAVRAALPVVRMGRDYPILLEGHHAYHTHLVSRVVEAARDLARLPFRAPRMHLVDGRGFAWSPWSTDPRELASYTLDAQVREPFDFTASLRVALRELAPDALVLLGPGESIGGAIGQTVVQERFFGIRSKEEFQARQREQPVLFALGRPDQRAKLLG